MRIIGGSGLPASAGRAAEARHVLLHRAARVGTGGQDLRSRVMLAVYILDSRNKLVRSPPSPTQSPSPPAWWRKGGSTGSRSRRPRPGRLRARPSAARGRSRRAGRSTPQWRGGGRSGRLDAVGISRRDEKENEWETEESIECQWQCSRVGTGGNGVAGGGPSVSLARELGRVRNRFRTTWRMPTSCRAKLSKISTVIAACGNSTRGTHDAE